MDPKEKQMDVDSVLQKAKDIVAENNYNCVELCKRSIAPCEGIPGQGFFNSFGSLTRFADKILPLFPEPGFKKYVELFCGKGEMLWCHKKSADEEFMNDLDDRIIRLHKICQGITEIQLDSLAKMDWVGSQKTFELLKNAKRPQEDLKFFYRELYLRRFSKSGRARPRFQEWAEGQVCNLIKRIVRCRERLQGVRIIHADYAKTLKQLDSKDTFFFIDPPYPDEGGYYPIKMPDLAVQAANYKNVAGKLMIVIEGSNKSLAALRKLNFVEKKFKLPRGWHNSPKGPDKSFVWASIFMNYQPNMLAAKKFFMPVMKVETVDITVSGKSLRMNHQKALEKSRDLIRHTKMEMALGFVADLVLSEDLICKRSDRLFPSTAGKCHIASRLLCLFPDHNGYIEPFAGGAALFFAKEKKPVEALNDTHAAVMTCYKFVQNITQEQINKLKKMNWVATRDHRKKLQESSPTDPLLIFHRLTMLRFSGFNKNENSKGMAREQEGKELKIIDRLIGAKERLKNTKLYCGDYRKIMSKYDGMKDIFFFLDPPYVNANVADIGVKEFDHKAFWECVYNLKSKYLVAYNQRDPEKKLGVKKIKHLAASNIGSKEYITYVLTNYDIQKESSVWRGFTKNQSEAIAFLPSDIQDNLRKINATIEKCLEVKLIPIDKKAPDDKQIAFGVVLEPNEVDSQGDIIPEAEIEKAAHLWLARYQDRGFMHDKIVNSKIEIYESYIAPTNLNINGQQVKKGTWLLMYHILDSELWKKIKSGEQTGFSMGGFARRVKV